jgi:hypothetical protein
MRLIENKKDIIDDKVFGNIYLKERNIKNSNFKILCSQNIPVSFSLDHLINYRYILN